MHVSNKRYCVSDMVFTAGKIRLKLLDNTGNAVLVKNLYLSCDSYMRNRMSKLVGSCIESMVPGEVHSNISRRVFISCKITMSMFLLNSFPPVTWTVKFDLWCFCWWSLVVQPISGLGVCKVVDSKYPDLKEGDLVGEMTGWEECSIITEPPSLFKIDWCVTFLLHWLFDKFIQ